MFELTPFTGNALKDRILLLLVSCEKAQSDDFACLHPSAKYLSKVIMELRNARIITTTNERPYVASITREIGAELINRVSPEAFEHYLKTTNNFHAGRTERHIDNARRAAGILALMEGANIYIGPQKPKLSDIISGSHPELTYRCNTFYLNKELKYSDEQKESKTIKSRSSGIVFSRGITGPVYNTGTIKLQLTRKPELEAVMRVTRYLQDIYAEPQKFICRDSIVVSDVTGQEANLLMPQNKSTGNRITIGDAIWNKSITGTAFRYIPKSIDGATSLKHITTTTREEFLKAAFTEEERRAAEKAGEGEAIIKGLICYEYLSCNVSKLAYIKRTYNDLTKVGIVCSESQHDFIISFMQTTNLRLRTIRNDKVDELLAHGRGELN